MKQQKLSMAILSTLGLILGTASFSTQALEQGDMFMRFTATQVTPDADSTAFTDPGSIAPNTFPDVGDDTTLGFTFVYMMTNNLGVEVLAALPFEHDVTVGGSKVGSTKHLPPVVSVQYYFNHEQKFRPYVGAGLNYTIFFNDKLDIAGGDLELDNSFGLAAQVGFDYDIDEKWFVSADVRYINIETTASNAALGSSDIDINPTVISVGVGYKF
ncbi:MAG: outer membrane beta-barrel protein [Gammaproteobacteria bacterium]|nr:outer membrane beta-barrel protein [Gammaproteobacteria bacterium]